MSESTEAEVVNTEGQTETVESAEPEKKVSVTASILESQKVGLLEKAESVSEGIREAVAAFLAAPAAETGQAPVVTGDQPIVWADEGTITLGDVVYVPLQQAVVLHDEDGAPVGTALPEDADGPKPEGFPEDHRHMRGPEIVDTARHGGVTTLIHGCYICGKPMP